MIYPAARLWGQGCTTLQISRQLKVREHEVYNLLTEIKLTATLITEERIA